MLSASLPDSHYNPHVLSPLSVHLQNKHSSGSPLLSDSFHMTNFQLSIDRADRAPARTMSGSQTFGAHSGQSPLERPGSAGTWTQAIHGARGAGPGRAEGTARRAGVPEAQRGVIASVGGCRSRLEPTRLREGAGPIRQVRGRT